MRIDLPDGEWWEIQDYCSRGLRKKLRAATQRAYALTASAGIDPADTEAVRAHMAEHIAEIDLDAADDAMLLYGTVAWSYPEPVSRAAIDALPDRVTGLVLVRMRELYSEPTEAEQKN